MITENLFVGIERELRRVMVEAHKANPDFNTIKVSSLLRAMMAYHLGGLPKVVFRDGPEPPPEAFLCYDGFWFVEDVMLAGLEISIVTCEEIYKSALGHVITSGEAHCARCGKTKRQILMLKDRRCRGEEENDERGEQV